MNLILGSLLLLASTPLLASVEIKTVIHLSDAEAKKTATTCSVTRKQIVKIKRSHNIYKATLDKLFEVSNSRLAPHFQKVFVQGGTAKIFFSKEAYDLLNGTTCNQETVQAPIEATLKAFPEVKAVEYYIDHKLVTGWDA